MPYTVVPHGDGFALKKRDGTLHKSSSGKVIEYHSKRSAVGAAHHIAVSEGHAKPFRSKPKRAKAKRSPGKSHPKHSSSKKPTGRAKSRRGKR